MSRSLKIIFTLSILANLLLAGTLIGMACHMQHRFSPPREISQAGQDIMRSTFKNQHDDMKASFMEMRKKREAVEKVVTADEFDPAAYERAVEDILKTRADISEKKAEIMGEILSKLSTEDREKVSKRLLDGLSGRPGKHGEHGKNRWKEGKNED